jgi:hypothetical protein
MVPFGMQSLSVVHYGCDLDTHHVSLFLSQGLFANFVPEVVQIIINRKRFDGSFTGVSGKT